MNIEIIFSCLVKTSYELEIRSGLIGISSSGVHLWRAAKKGLIMYIKMKILRT